MLKEFLETRKRELSIDERRLQNEDAADQRAHTYAMAALEAKKTENASLQNIYGGALKTRNITLAIAVVCLIALAFYCVGLGKEALVLEALRTIGLLVGGGGLGFVFGFRKGKQDARSDQVDD